MKKIILLCLVFITELSYSAEYVHNDEIRGGINQIILTANNNPNAMLVFFEREKTIQLQFKSPEHVHGTPLGNPTILWPKITSQRYSIRFDLIDGNSVVLENIPAVIHTEIRPDNKVRYSLSLIRALSNYEKFYFYYQTCNRIVLEYNEATQLVFTRNR